MRILLRALAPACLIVLAAIAVAAADTVAVAPAAPSTVVDVASLVSGLAQLIFVIAGSVAAAIVNKHVKDADARKTILAALDNGVAYGMNKVEGALAGRPLTVNLGSAVAAQAVRYAQATVPDKLARLDLDAAHIAKIAVAKLPGVDGAITDADLAGIVAAAKGNAPPLPPAGDLAAQVIKIIRQGLADGSLKLPAAA